MYSWDAKAFDVTEMLGKTFAKVEKVSVDEIRFTAENGDVYLFHHDQDCCERVEVKDIVGDLNDLVGAPLLEAAVVTDSGHGEWESWTWTFYKFGTIKGHVNISWDGRSNGYYSEAVHHAFIPADKNEEAA